MVISRIGIDARLIAYREGGIAEYARRLIESLSTLDRENIYTLFRGRHALLVPDDPPDAPNFRNARAQTPCHHRLERIAFGLEVAVRRLDLLHSPDFIPPRFGARRFVITIHDLTFLHYPQFQTPDSRRYYEGQIRAAVRRADHILVDSEATQADVCAFLGVEAGKVTVHPLGVDPAFRPLAAEAVTAMRSRYELPEGYLLFVGTYEPRKNLPGLLEAYSLLVRRAPDSPPLVIAGRRGWLFESIFEKATSLGLGERVRWLEDVPFVDLPALYNGAAVLVLPSFYEGFGFPPLEAMACGVPPVVSNRGSLPEIVGTVGILCDPDRPESIADAVYLALTDRALRETWRREGLERARIFTWQQTARITLDVYRKMLDR